MQMGFLLGDREFTEAQLSVMIGLFVDWVSKNASTGGEPKKMVLAGFDGYKSTECGKLSMVLN